MNAVVTLLGKEISLFLKDKTAVLMSFVVPFLLTAIVGMVFGNLGSGDSGPSVKAKIAVFAEAPNAESDALIKGLQSEESLNVITGIETDDGTETAFTEESLRQGIEDNKYNFALYIPEDFLKTDSMGIKLKLIYNPKNDIETQMVNGLMQKAIFMSLPKLLSGQLKTYTDTVLNNETYDNYLDDMARVVSQYFEIDYEIARKNVSFDSLLETFDSQGESGESGMGDFVGNLIEIEKDQVYGSEVKNPNLTRMIGGYALMFLLFSVNGSSTSLFEEKNEGLFARLLSMPVKRHHILWSKYIFNTILGTSQVIVLFFFSSLLFDVDIFSNFISLLVVAVLTASACTAFGMCLASVSSTPAQAQGLGTLIILTMSSLGGAWWPVEFMPSFLQPVSQFTIVYWGVQGFLAALWEGAYFTEFLPILGMILLFTIVLNAFSIWRFKKGQLFN